MRQYLAIIPARGDSVRLPHKNLLSVGGVPLVVRAIQVAQGVERITRIVVFTDDDAIGELARRNGAQIVQEPAYLANEPCAPHLLISFVIDTLEKHSGGMYRAGHIVLLQPTSPLRTSEDISGALDLYESGDCDSVTSICSQCESTRGNPLKENGAVYVTHASLVRQGSIYGRRLKMYDMPPERSIDVDTQAELDRAEIMLTGGTPVPPVHKGWPKGKKRK